ncbi:hypothetical protein [Enterococcus phage vB_OCPT_SDS2]|nr:hypothetical protein [Enterococcus phage vB_OCPT_SDS2]
MDKPYVALTNIHTGKVVYCTDEWLFQGSITEATPCKSIEYVDMSFYGMDSYYRVAFKANQYTYEEELPASHFTAVQMLNKEED